jgi:predicted dehydrogenase
VRWICDKSAERLEAMGARHPESKTTAELGDVLGDDAVGAVAISTPVNTHFDIARAALAAGKHVMIEKPITATSEEGRELVRLGAEAERVLMVGHVFEYNASIRAVKELIRGGDLGQVQYMSFVRTNLGPVRTDVNALWDLASHDVSIMSYFLDDYPTDVTARGQAWLNAEVEDAVFATFSFGTGALAHVNVSWLNPQKVRRITVVGDKKMAVWDDLDMQRPIQIFDRHVEAPEVPDSYLDYKTAVVDGGVFIPSLRLNQPLQAECEHFLDCVESGERPQSDGLSGLRVVLALEAATTSMREGSVVTPIPPVQAGS